MPNYRNQRVLPVEPLRIETRTMVSPAASRDHCSLVAETIWRSKGCRYKRRVRHGPCGICSLLGLRLPHRLQTNSVDMWYLLLLVALTASAADPERKDPKEVRLNYIITNQELHLDKLEKLLHELEEEFGELSEDVGADDIKHLKARVRNLEDEHHHECKDYEASCGGDVPQCISKLLFCDGHKDCRNGHDEDHDHCDEAPAHVGSSFTGVATWESCEDLLPHHIVVTITASKTEDYFGAVVWVRGILSFQEETKGHKVRTYQLRGIYVFGTRTLLLGPERGTKPIYGVKCEFKFGDDDSAYCQVVNPASHSVCAHFQAARY